MYHEITHLSPDYPNIHKGLSHSNHLLKKTQQRIHALGQPQNTQQINASIQKYIGSTVLRTFLRNHPAIWTALICVVHSAILKRSDDTLEFDARKKDNLFGLFLIRGREEDIGDQLKKGIESDILNNEPFWQFCTAQDSFLDMGSHMFDHTCDENHAKSIIKSMIVRGMIDNIDDCTFKNIDTHLASILPKITEYIPIVFGQAPTLYQEFRDKRTLDELIATIATIITNKQYTEHWNRRVDIMRLIKAFHAWGDIDNIEKAQKNAVHYANPENIKILLNKAKIQLLECETTHNPDGILYKGKVKIGTKHHSIHWRAKSMKSILHKLWETQEYTNVDALRDTLGISILCDDNASSKEVSRILNTIIHLMPHYGYIIRDRGLAPDYQVDRRSKKKPLLVSNHQGGTSNSNFQNVSVGGFTHLDNVDPCGTEFQVLRTGAFEWKKNEDPYYKVRGILNLLCRGEFFITPEKLQSSLEELIGHKKLDLINRALHMTQPNIFEDIQNIESLIQFLIQEKILLQYTNNNGNILYVSAKYRTPFEKTINPEVWKEQSQRIP